jgi:hypothetical protein
LEVWNLIGSLTSCTPIQDIVGGTQTVLGDLSEFVGNPNKLIAHRSGRTERPPEEAGQRAEPGEGEDRRRVSVLRRQLSLTLCLLCDGICS